MSKQKNTGKALESIVLEIYKTLSKDESNTTVELDVKLESPDGPRQFDVVVTSVVAGGQITLTTVIEVRDYASRLSIEKLDAFRSKMIDVNANKGIMISKVGFQKGAVRKAKRQKIDLYTVHRLGDLEKFKSQTPVVVHALSYGLIQMNADIQSPAELIDFSKVFVNDIHFFQVLSDQIRAGDLQLNILSSLSDEDEAVESEIRPLEEVVDLENMKGINTWLPADDSKIEYRKYFSTKPISLSGLEVKFQLYYEYYFGYVTDLPNTVAMSNILDSSAEVFFVDEDIDDFQMHFNKFSSLDEIPVRQALNYHALENKDFSRVSDSFKRIVKKFS